MKSKVKKFVLSMLCIMIVAVACGIIYSIGLNMNAYADEYIEDFDTHIAGVCNDEYASSDIEVNDGDSSVVQKGCVKYIEPPITPYATILNHSTCNALASTHGPGRAKGYQDNFFSQGCCNYKGYWYTYGSTDIPFYMDLSTMTSERADEISKQICM